MCLDVPVDCVAQKDRFLDNVLYISGFVIHKLIEKKNEPIVKHISQSAEKGSAASMEG